MSQECTPGFNLQRRHRRKEKSSQARKPQLLTFFTRFAAESATSAPILAISAQTPADIECIHIYTLRKLQPSPPKGHGLHLASNVIFQTVDVNGTAVVVRMASEDQHDAGAAGELTAL